MTQQEAKQNSKKLCLSLPVLELVSAVVAGDYVHQEDVGGGGVQPPQPDLVGGEHAPATHTALMQRGRRRRCRGVQEGVSDGLDLKKICFKKCFTVTRK